MRCLHCVAASVVAWLDRGGPGRRGEAWPRAWPATPVECIAPQATGSGVGMPFRDGVGLLNAAMRQGLLPVYTAPVPPSPCSIQSISTWGPHRTPVGPRKPALQSGKTTSWTCAWPPHRDRPALPAVDLFIKEKKSISDYFFCWREVYRGGANGAVGTVQQAPGRDERCYPYPSRPSRTPSAAPRPAPGQPALPAAVCEWSVPRQGLGAGQRDGVASLGHHHHPRLALRCRACARMCM